MRAVRDCTVWRHGVYLNSLKAPVPLSELSVSEVREELLSVLSSSSFRQSPRGTKLLRYICAIALMDETERITEYTIALDVLGKAEDFKEGKDSIVRVEVHRLRKRLAEFYEGEGAAHRVRIVVPAGSYVPQFQIHEGCTAAEPVGAVPAGSRSGSPKTDFAAQSEWLPAPSGPAPGIQGLLIKAAAWWRRRASRAWVACAGGLLLAAVLAAFEMHGSGKQVLDAFWNPVLSSSSQVLLCIGNLSGGHTYPVSDGDGPLTLKQFHNAPSQTVHFADAITLTKFASMVQARGKRYRVVSQTEATYADLQNGPAILIGLLNNDWTKRLVGSLRFTVDRKVGGKVLIRDRTNPLRSDWSIDYYAPLLEISKDYALVMRATDPKTEQMVVAAAGMSVFGTLAAGEFITDENEIRKLAAVAPKGWERKNMEIVLSTDVIRANPGPPKVVATYFW
jgi:hypothetical protein